MPYDANFVQAAQDGSDKTLIFISINYTGGQINLVNNNEDINGYTAANLSVEKPSQPDGGIPSARVTLDNIGIDLGPIIDAANGLPDATIEFKEALVKSPTVTQSTITLFLKDISVTANQITGKCTFFDLYNRSGFNQYYSDKTAPALK